MRRVITALAVALLVACSDGLVDVQSDRQLEDRHSVALSNAGFFDSIIEDFAGTEVNTGLWTVHGPPDRVVQNDRLEIWPTPNSDVQSGLLTAGTYSIAGSSFMAEFSQDATGSSGTETFIGVLRPDYQAFAVISSRGGMLLGFYKRQHEAQPAVAGAITLNPVQHRFRRIREQNGTVFLETSPNGLSWTTRWTVTNIFTAPTNLIATIGAAAVDAANSNPTPAHIENVNTTVPAIPRGLTATAASDTRIDLAWQDRSVNETGFIIERRPASDGEFTEIATVGANVTAYTDEGLPAATAFEYRVLAVNASGASAPTNTASATTQEPPPPPVIDLAITAIDAPATATLGDAVEVDVTLANVGEAAVGATITVTLRDASDAIIGTETVEGLGAADSVVVSFSWNTAGASLGDNTLTASHDFSDDEAGNDQVAVVVTLEEEEPPPPPAVVDLAITAVEAPANATRGDTVEVSVTLSNTGEVDIDETVTITLRDGAEQVIGTAMVEGLASGTSVVRVFSWITASAPLGDNTLTASHGFSDDEAENDQAAAVVALEEGAPPTPPAVVDLAITAVAAPASATRGDTVEVSVTLSNTGEADIEEAVTVTLRDASDAIIGTETVEGLGAADSVVVSFSWNTAGASLGDNTLTASHDFSDDEAGNDQVAVVVTLEEETLPPPPPVHTLTDDFAGTVLDASRWEIVEGAERMTLDNRLEIKLAPNTIEQAYLRSVDAFDFTGSHAFVEVSAVAEGSDAMETTLLVGTADLVQYVALASYDGRLTAWEQWEEDKFFLIGSRIPLNIQNHRFRRIRESGGTVYFETSADGTSWTTRWHVQHEFDDPTRLHVFIGVTAWEAKAQNPTAAHIEGFNTLVPASPRDLTATAASPGTIEVVWQDQSVNETGFRVERRLATGGAFTEIATVDANVTTYTDVGLAPATTFEYRVRAYNASGESAPSAAASATTSEPPSATPPIANISDAFVGTGIDGSRWTVYGPAGWTTQDDRLVITPAPSASGFAGARSVLPHTLTGSAIQTEISQVAGGSAEVETFLRVTSDAGDDYVMIGASDGQLFARYRWNGGAIATPGSPITYSPAEHRFLRLREDGGTIYFETSATGTAWSTRWTTVNQFAAPTLLYADVGAGAQGGTGASPTAAYFEGVNTLLPATPRNLTATAVGETRIDLSWHDVSANESGFSIERRSGGSFSEIATVGANVTSYEDLTVQGGRSYEYRIRATNEQGASSYTNVAQATTPGTPGAQYSWSAADYANGTALTDAGWTVRSNNAGWVVREVSGVKVARLESIKGVGTSEHITLDVVDNDPDRDDVEVLIGGVVFDRLNDAEYLILDAVGRFRENSTTHEFYGVGHAFDPASNLQANVLFIWPPNGSPDILVPPAVSSWTTSTRGFLLIRITGNVVRGKVWTGSVENEPASWTFESTNAVIPGLGSVGVHYIGRPSDRPTFEYVTVGTGGKPAPRLPF